MAQSFEAKREGLGSNQELRRLTVMFCDIVGSTELGAELDIEDYCALIEDFQALSQEKIDESGGWLAQFLGDGVLAYFGYPKLFEDPARRAVRAGLAIVRELEARAFRMPSGAERRLSARISVHSGPVMVPKDSAGAPQLPEGMSVNVAKKAQDFAENNTVVVTSEVEGRIRRSYELKPPRFVAIGNVAQDFAIYEVVGEKTQSGRPEAEPPPIVARQGELGFVADRWEMAQQGMGQCVLLVGEAGIGKSRLMQELKRRKAIQADSWFDIRCTPDTAESALFPFREFFAGHLLGSGAATNMPPLHQRIGAHLEGMGLSSQANEQALLWLLNAVPVAFDNGDPDPAVPALVRKRISDFLVEYFLACAEMGAIVLAFEDLHWADASTMEIVRQLSLRCRNAPILLVCAQRPEGAHSFSGRDDITSLVLNPLHPAQVKEFVDQLSGDAEISEQEAKRLFELTGGNPLFVEHYIAYGGDFQRRGGAASEPIPPTLQELMTYHLEQLGDAKRVAQCASVLGQVVHPHVLRSVVDDQPADFERKIETLIQSQILAEAGETDLPSLSFRHALIREAAYESLLGSERRQIHRRVAERLAEEQSSNDLIPHEVIARHFGLARDPRRSIAHWELAAAHASARFANDEALSQLEEALRQVPALPEEEAETTEIRLRSALTAPLEALRGWAAEETEKNLKRLLELQSARPDEPGLFNVYHGLCSVHGIRGEVSKALDYAAQMQATAERTGDPTLRILSLRVSGILRFLIAEFPTSRQLFEQMTALYSDEIRESLLAYYPANPVAVGYAFSAWAHALTGEGEQARACLDKAGEMISSAKDEFTRAYVEGFASSVFICTGDHEDAIERASRCLSLSEKNSFDYWVSWANINLGYGNLVTGRGEEDDLARMEKGLKAYRSTGSRQLLPYAYGVFADALVRSGQEERALGVIEDIETERRGNEVCFFDAFNERLIAWRREKLASSGDGDA